MKDLSKLGRDLSKTLIVDNNPANFLLQPENGIYIKSWYQNPDDNALVELSEVLVTLRTEEHSDLREGLKLWREKLGNKIN